MSNEELIKRLDKMITTEQEQKILEDIKRMIPHLARTNGVHNDDIIKIMSEAFMSET